MNFKEFLKFTEKFSALLSRAEKILGKRIAPRLGFRSSNFLGLLMAIASSDKLAKEMNLGQYQIVLAEIKRKFGYRTFVGQTGIIRGVIPSDDDCEFLREGFQFLAEELGIPGIFDFSDITVDRFEALEAYASKQLAEDSVADNTYDNTVIPF